MAEFEEKLGTILNNPQAMQQIMALARSLGGDSPQKSGDASAPAAPSLPSDQVQEAVYEPVAEEEQPLAGAGLDPRLLEMGMRAISAYQDPGNEKAALLQALRPFVKEERYKKVDKAVQIAKISKAIRAVLDGFKGGNEDV